MSTVETPAIVSRPPGDALGTGRRKTSVARVRVRAGNGTITVNGRPFEQYFVNEQDRNAVLSPLEKSGLRGNVDVLIKAHGGGNTGQSGAVKMGLARALKLYDPSVEAALREANLLTRDSRMKERKHYGLRGARRGTQFSKR